MEERRERTICGIEQLHFTTEKYKKDFLFLFPSDMYCIHPEQCYCKDEDGHYYPPGYSYDFDCQHW